jgi:uncharacterized spore protein YtfJ
MDAKEMMRELADRIQKTANVRAVFGEPMGQGADVVIPVAKVKVRGGGGGGSGEEPGDEQEGGRRKGRGKGMGLGMNVATTPVGYIKMGRQGPVFVPVVDKNQAVLGGMMVAGLGMLLLKSIIWSKKAKA